MVDLVDSKGNRVQQWKLSDEAFDFMKAQQRRMERATARKVSQWDVMDAVLARIPQTDDHRPANVSQLGQKENLISVAPIGSGADRDITAASDAVLAQVLEILEALRSDVKRLESATRRDGEGGQAGAAGSRVAKPTRKTAVPVRAGR